MFVIACLPRRLLAAYADLADPELGYLEYRLPTLAAAIGLRLVDDERFAAWRPADTGAGRPTRRQRFLNGSRRPIVLTTVLVELARSGGVALFHPYHGLFPLNAHWACARARVGGVQRRPDRSQRDHRPQRGSGAGDGDSRVHRRRARLPGRRRHRVG